MKYYTDEKNIQMMIALMKAHNVKRVVASPGSTNVAFVGSIQNDSFFEIYSSVDERSAAYIACGLASETGEPVALSCTGATASRNYFPGLTEAYYRNLPILAITSTQFTGRIGHNIAQVIDRSVQPNDIVKLSVNIPTIHCEEDEWACNIDINKALLELRRDGGGPVHINLATSFSSNFSVKTLPTFRVINRCTEKSNFPDIKKGKLAIFVGNHLAWDKKLTEAVDAFCEKYNGAVFYDHSSNYNGKYGILIGAMPGKATLNASSLNVDILIHIGCVSASSLKLNPKEVWRINPDGEIRDTFKKLTVVFEMEEYSFFERYILDGNAQGTNIDFYKEWRKIIDDAVANTPDIPFSSSWIASKTIKMLPDNSVLHLGILNSLYTWNRFETVNNISVCSNTGGFGIDGILSTVVGASFVHPDKLYFCVLGDLAFFYDMNSLGNRHIGNNLRIMLVNNGLGHSLISHNNVSSLFINDGADKYICAEGHYGRKSPMLVKHFAEDLGFKYMTASSKEEYLDKVNEFVDPHLPDQSVIFEVFTNSSLENEAYEKLNKIGYTVTMSAAESAVRKIMGEKGIKAVKKIMKK